MVMIILIILIILPCCPPATISDLPAGASVPLLRFGGGGDVHGGPREHAGVPVHRLRRARQPRRRPE